MYYPDLSLVTLYAYRFHHTFTGGGAVPWINIDVLAPQAVGTVIRVAIALYELVAIFTAKGLDSSLKALGHTSYRYSA